MVKYLLDGEQVRRCKKCTLVHFVVYVVAIFCRVVRLVVNLCVKTFFTYVTRNVKYEVGIEAG